MSTKRRSQKAGLPPGTLIYIGDKKVETPRISLIEFDEFHINEKQLIDLTDWKPVSDGKTVTWLDIGGLHQIRANRGDRAVLQSSSALTRRHRQHRPAPESWTTIRTICTSS